MTDFINKYLKYKHKYLMIKNNIGGSDGIDRQQIIPVSEKKKYKV